MSRAHPDPSSRPVQPPPLAPDRRPQARGGGHRIAGLARRARTLAVAFMLGLGLAAACGDDSEATGDDAGCEQGYLNCSCFPNFTCLAGLVCSGTTCVPPAGTGTGATATTDGTGSTGGTTDGTGGTTQGTTTTGETSSTGGSTTTSGTEEGGPVIVDFGTNVKTITEGESVIFTATITDPDGPDDIQGGSLKSGDESLTYGAFTDLGNGTYELTLSWAAIDQATGIEFAGKDTIDFKAVFFDNGGKKGFATTTIDLTCGDTYSILACDGHCVEANADDENCGTCGNVCQGTSECRYGTCEADWGECLVSASTPYNTCADYCLAQGEVCVGACEGEPYSIWYWPEVNTCNGDVDSYGYYDDPCTEDIYLDPMYILSARCCCTVDALWPAN